MLLMDELFLSPPDPDFLKLGELVSDMLKKREGKERKGEQ